MASKGELYSALIGQNAILREALLLNSVNNEKNQAMLAEVEQMKNAPVIVLAAKIASLRRENEALQQALDEKKNLLRGWIISHQAYRQLFLEKAKEDGMNEAERQDAYNKMLIQIGLSPEGKQKGLDETEEFKKAETKIKQR